MKMTLHSLLVKRNMNVHHLLPTFDHLDFHDFDQLMPQFTKLLLKHPTNLGIFPKSFHLFEVQSFLLTTRNGNSLETFGELLTDNPLHPLGRFPLRNRHDTQRLSRGTDGELRPQNERTPAPDGFHGLPKAILRDKFTFVISHMVCAISVAEAVPLPPAVREQFQLDARARIAVMCDCKIDSTSCSSLEALLSKAEAICQRSHQNSLILLRLQLRNAGLNRFFFSSWVDAVGAVAVRLSNAFAGRSRVDGMLSNESFVLDNDDLPL
jgi:hypothetical protein